MFVQINTHVQDALARLISQYKASTNFQSLITAFVLQVQLIEEKLFDMNVLRYLTDAVGVQLDNIGQIVGLPRPPGLSDSAYRLELLGQIKINISQGQPEQVIQVFLLFTMATQVRVFEKYPAELLVQSPFEPTDQDAINSILRILSDTAPAGVAINGLFIYDPDEPFAYRVNVAPGEGYNTGKYATLKRGLYPFGYRKNSSKLKGYGTRRDVLVGGAYVG